MAREWCSCGAAIRGRRKHVLEWRTSHLHTSGEPDPEPQMDGSHAQVELAGFPDKTYTDDGPRQPNIIGFRINPPEAMNARGMRPARVQYVPQPRPAGAGMKPPPQPTMGRLSNYGPEFVAHPAPAVAPTTPSGIYNP